jgi:hypothetical protein
MNGWLGKSALAALLLASLARAESKAVAVWAFGAADKDEAAHLSDELGKVPGVAASKVEELSPDGARLSVTLSQGNAAALAQAIEQAPALPLTVEAVTGERILARTGPSRSARVLFRIKPFEDKSKDKKLADPARLAADAMKVLLENAPFLVEAPNPDDALLIFTGRVAREDKTLVYEVRILRSKSGEIAYGKGKGAAGLSETIQQLVKQLPQRLAELEGAHFQKDAALMALPKAMERARRGLPLRLVKAEAVVDPAQLAQYGTSPVATLWVEDTAGKAISGAVAHALLEGLSSGAKDSAPLELKPGAPARIPVLAALDAAQVSKSLVPHIAPLKVNVTFKQGDLDRVATFVVPVQVGAQL